MASQCRPSRKHVPRKPLLRSRPAIDSQRGTFQQLENRWMLTGYFDQIAEQVAGPSGAIANIEAGLQAVNSLTRLPLINKQINQISELQDTLQSFRSDLYTTIRSLDPASGQAAVRHSIYEALGPNGLGILVSKTNAAQVTENDVVVTLNSSGVDISIDIGFTGEQFSSAVGLGIDAVPFKPQNNTSGAFSVGLKYHDFHFGYNTTSGVYFRTDTSANELQFTLMGFLPTSFSAGLGFMNVSVTDRTPGTAPQNADLTLTLSSDVTGGIGGSSGPVSISTPKLGGGLNLLAGVEVQAGGEGMPKLRTDLRLQWTLPDVSAGVPLGSSWGAPTLRFENVQIELGALLGDLVQPIAEDIRQILKPLDPIFAVLDARIPGVSDVAEELGFGSINLVSMSEALSALPSPPTGVIDVINSASKLRSYANTIKSLADLGAGGWITIGSFNISGPQGNSLLNTAQAALGNAGLANWSSLVTTDGGVNFDGVKQQIVGLLGSDLGNQVNDIWEKLTSSSEEMGGITFDFPIVKDPTGVAMGMLLGQDRDLVSVTGRLDLEFDKEIPIVVIPGFKIQIAGHGDVHAFAQLGYDTRGLREAITPMYSGGSFDPAKTLNGLWVHGDTRVDVNGSLDVQAVAGFDPIATFRVGGGLGGFLHAGLSHPANYNPGQPKLRIFAGDFSSGNLFDVNGFLDGHANMRLKIGVDTPLGFAGYDKTWTFASVRLFEFDTAHFGMPGSLVAPPATTVQLYSYDSSTRTLILLAGPNAGPGSSVNENFTVNHISRLEVDIGGPISIQYFDTFDISAFGVTQRYFGDQVDRVYVDMGDGNDTIKVIDPFIGTLYSLHGGSGDDTIDIDGSVKFAIYGEAGKDTIDAGYGTIGNFQNRIDGGPDADTITFGDGNLAKMIPGSEMYIVRAPDDYSLDRVIIDNSRARNPFFYDFYRNLAPYDETINISDTTSEPSRWIYTSRFDAVTVYSGSGDDNFTGIPSTYSKIYGNGGNDHFSPGNGFDAVLPVENATFAISTLYYSGGSGHDSITLTDTATRTPRSYLLGVIPGNNASTAVVWSDAVGSFGVLLSGMEETAFRAYEINPVKVTGWDTGLLELTAGEVQLAASAAMWWDTTISVRFTQKVTLLDSANDGYQTGGGIDAIGPYVYLQGGYKIRLDFDQFSTRFSFQVDNTRIDVTPELVATNWQISLDGGDDSQVSIFTPLTSTANTGYRVTKNKIYVNSFLIGYSSVGTVRIHAGAGNDNLQVDGSTLGLSVVYDGGLGQNTAVIDNSTYTGPTLWVVDHDYVWNLLQYDVYLDNISNFSILGGTGDDQFNVLDDFPVSVTIDAGKGNDTFQIGRDDFATTFGAPARFSGGDGDDTFNWYSVDNVLLNVVSPVTLDGGSGANSLFIDDRGRAAYPTTYNLYPDRVRAQGFAAPATGDFNYYNMSYVKLTASDNNDTFYVRGISSSVTQAFAIEGGGGNDTVLALSRDEQGAASLLGSLVVTGGAGLDRLLLAAETETQAGAYTIDSLVGVINVDGFGDGVAVGNDVEELELRTGSGDDFFKVENYNFTSTLLEITAGLGNDSVQVASGDLYHTIPASAQFAFDGGDGADTFFVDNSLSNDRGSYTRDGAALRILRVGTSNAYNFAPVNFENMEVTAGSGDDNFFLEALPAGQTLTYRGSEGFDRLAIQQTNRNTQAVQGRVYFDGGTGGGNVVVDNSANTTGVRATIDPTAFGTMGATPGDTLFGPGGSLQYTSLAGLDSSIALTLGSGPDVVFATPQVSSQLSIQGGGGSDQLRLALAGVVNPVHRTLTAGTGQILSDSHQTLTWHSFEDFREDYVFPPSFVVTNTNDSGPGSLRQAILTANATANVGGPDVIRFAIPAYGAHTIKPLSRLPGITDSVIIDGTTQLGYSGKPVIEIDGSLAGGANGLEIYSGGNTVRGLAINHFVGGANAALWISGPGGNLIQSNYIGTNLAGTAGFAFASQSSYGIVVFGSSNNVIGTNGDGSNDAVEGNLLSGNNTAGILLMDGQPGQLSSNNVVAGNRIGTNAEGTAAISNGRMGVFVLGTGTNNRVGTNSDGVSDTAERNLISGNTETGVYIGGGTFVVAGNYIGTTADGSAALPNGVGVRIEGASNNRVSGNLIAFNTSHGVSIERGAGNSVLGNSIYNNALLGINLWAPNEGGAQVTPNDSTDADAGSNNLQNFPLISTAASVSGQVAVAGTLQSTPNTTFRVEFFANTAVDSSGNGEGQTYLSFVMLTTNANGLASYVTTLPAFVPTGRFITATATDPAGNTSEFSAGVKLVDLGSLTNVKFLSVPGTGTPFVISSPAGTTLTATASAGAGVTPPNGLVFPFGFVTFAVSGLASGAATTVIIAGLDVSQIGDYYKYGRTPANGANHWYNFLYNQATDSDSAVGTGMEIASGNIVLHLIDGKRGDDDRVANGVIADIGGAVLNHAPVATNDTATTNEDTVVNLSTSTLLGNDKDVDKDSLKIIGVGGAVNGTVSLSGNTIKFTPAADFNGTAGFDYTLSDGYLSTTGRVTVTVKEVNDAPVANTDTATVNEDGSIDIAVLTNDTRGPANENGQTLTIKSASALHGTVTLNSNGTLRYRPAGNYFGADTIKYTIADNGTTAGKSSPLTANGVVNVTVLSVNDAPVANDQSASVTEDGKVSIKLNGSDLETASNSLIFTITSLPAQGQLSTSSGTPVQIGDRFTGAPTLIYEPGAAREGTGSDSFKYTVTDNGGAAGALSDPANVAVSITQAVSDGKVTVDSSGIVRVGGTSGNDSIHVTRTNNSKLQVTINNKVVSNNISLSSVREIHIWGRAGNDKIIVLLLDVPTVLQGGSGNDEMYGGSGSSLMFGGAGNDTLVGGVAHNLLVGGDGSDTLIDAFGDDVLVGGNLSKQLTDELLRQMVQQWSSTRSQNSRFAQGLLADNATDYLFDSLGDDWFVLDSTDSKTDRNPSDHDLVTWI